MTPHTGRWYYLTMPKVRIRPHPLDDPDMSEGHRVMREICSRMIRTTRTQVGWTQRRLAEASGVSLSTVAKAEQARQNLSMDTLVALMSTMGFGIGLVAYTPGESVFDTAERLLGIDPRDTGEEEEDDLDSNHEEDDPPDPADTTEEELNEDIDRILEEVPL